MPMGHTWANTGRCIFRMIPLFMKNFILLRATWDTVFLKQPMRKIGVLICWDQWYPEAARITSLMGAEIFFIPTAIGWSTMQDQATNEEQFNAWQTIQRSHAIANGVHVVSVNRVGFEQDGAMKFWGGSFISNPFGRILYQAGHDREEVAVQELDTAKTDSYRTHWPFMRDRRIDSYQPITKRFIDEALAGPSPKDLGYRFPAEFEPHVPPG